jgi:phospholipid/cholesterol/gamma-HCH transport system permease protein
MPRASDPGNPVLRAVEAVGRGTVRSVESVGFGANLLSESVYWLFLGRRRRQPVRAAPVFVEMMQVGIGAVPIVSMLSLTIGVMLAIQGIDVLKPYGAEQRVVIGVAKSVVREFAPLITGILVAGRSGSALAARLGTMTISNEIDALKVMGVNPVRFLVVPSLIAMVVMLPALTLWSNLLALLGAGLYITGDLKSAIFAVLITLIGVANGSGVSGGAEGVGRVTTQSVVHSITAIVLTDMLFVFAVTR